MEKSIYVAYGSDIKKTARLLLEAAGVLGIVPRGAKVSLKPNLVVGRPADEGATTHTEIVAGLIEHLKDGGVSDIEIIEGSWVGDDTRRAYSRCGFDEISRRYGVPLFDLKKDSAVSVKTPIGPVKICAKALHTDFLVNLPVLKGHCQTAMTCALKNMKGCIPDSEKRRFHALGLHQPIAALASVLKPALILVDGVCGDLNFEEGGNPVRQDRLILSGDPVKTDVYACHLMGIDPSEVDYIALAERYGAGSASLDPSEIFQVNQPEYGHAPVKRSHKVASLARRVSEDKACSACYGALIHALARLEEQGRLSAVPPVAIGQGWRGKSFEGVGVGTCACGAARCAVGCPPDAQSILEELSRANDIAK